MPLKLLIVCEILIIYLFNRVIGKTGADWDSAPEQTGTLLMLQS